MTRIHHYNYSCHSDAIRVLVSLSQHEIIQHILQPKIQTSQHDCKRSTDANNRDRMADSLGTCWPRYLFELGFGLLEKGDETGEHCGNNERQKTNDESGKFTMPL